MMREPVVIECDVVVVGTGAAGMMSALIAAENGAKVCCISKMPFHAPSCTTRAYGDMTWSTHRTREELVRQIVEVGGSLSNQRQAFGLALGVSHVLNKLRVLGVQFDEPKSAGEGMPGTVRWSYRGTDSGQQVLDRIKAAALRHQVTFLHGCAATEVLIDANGEACGIAAIGLAARQPVILRSWMVVLATGGGAGIFARTDNPPGTTGDGIAMAYEAGAELVDLELISFGYPEARIADVLERGEELRDELLELGHAHYFLGGARIPWSNETEVDGLYAVGEVSGGVFGAGRLGGSALADCFEGAMAIHSWVNLEIERLDRIGVHDDEVQAACDRIETILRGTTHPAPLQERIREICWRGLGPVKTEASITRALEELEELSPEIAFCGGANREAIRTAVEVRHMHTVAQLVARASLERRETRGCYWRADYPEPDNETQLGNIILRKGKDGPEVTSEPPRMDRVKDPTTPRIGAGCFGYIERETPRADQG